MCLLVPDRPEDNTGACRTGATGCELFGIHAGGVLETRLQSPEKAETLQPQIHLSSSGTGSEDWGR